MKTIFFLYLLAITGSIYGTDDLGIKFYIIPTQQNSKTLSSVPPLRPLPSLCKSDLKKELLLTLEGISLLQKIEQKKKNKSFFPIMALPSQEKTIYAPLRDIVEEYKQAVPLSLQRPEFYSQNYYSIRDCLAQELTDLQEKLQKLRERERELNSSKKTEEASIRKAMSNNIEASIGLTKIKEKFNRELPRRVLRYTTNLLEKQNDKVLLGSFTLLEKLQRIIGSEKRIGKVIFQHVTDDPQLLPDYYSGYGTSFYVDDSTLVCSRTPECIVELMNHFTKICDKIEGLSIPIETYSPLLAQDQVELNEEILEKMGVFL